MIDVSYLPLGHFPKVICIICQRGLYIQIQDVFLFLSIPFYGHTSFAPRTFSQSDLYNLPEGLYIQIQEVETVSLSIHTFLWS